MENLLISQKISLFIIVVPAIVLTLAFIILSKKIGVWLITYGLIVGGVGIISSILFKNSIMEVIMLIDTEGFGRAYVVGCMLTLTGMLVKLWEIIASLKKK